MTMKEGMQGWFTPGPGQDRIRAEVVKVWSDTCVNLRTEAGTMPSSVLVTTTPPRADCSGYYFEPDDQGAALAPHQLRVVEEKAALKDKLVKLVSFIESPNFATLAEDERVRLKVQSTFMDGYLRILEQRIAAF